jgi:hypothetical protein
LAERRRWDGDERFRGVADAGGATADVDRLLAQTREPGWVTEDPDLHLAPSCLPAAASLGLDIVVAGRIAAYGLVGAIAESSTHIREYRNEDGSVIVLEALTGVLPGDGPFASHGHQVRVRLLTSAG